MCLLGCIAIQSIRMLFPATRKKEKEKEMQIKDSLTGNIK